MRRPFPAFPVHRTFHGNLIFVWDGRRPARTPLEHRMDGHQLDIGHHRFRMLVQQRLQAGAIDRFRRPVHRGAKQIFEFGLPLWVHEAAPSANLPSMHCARANLARYRIAATAFSVRFSRAAISRSGVS